MGAEDYAFVVLFFPSRNFYKSLLSVKFFIFLPFEALYVIWYVQPPGAPPPGAVLNLLKLTYVDLHNLLTLSSY